MQTGTKRNSIRIGLWLGVATLSIGAPGIVEAGTAQTRVDISAQPLAATLTRIGRETDADIIFVSADVRGKQAPPVRGAFTPQEALEIALQGTALSARRTSQGAYLIEKDEAKAAKFADARDEIIVTARKRQESVLQVPVVTAVLSQAQLERSQVTTLSAIASLTPGVVLGMGTLETGTLVSIRGVGTSSANPGVDQSIALNLDGLQVSQGSAYSVGVFDMAQVEVLKGPQALFFGKNSPGGVISIRTADPGDRFELIGRVGHEFEADETRGELIASGPVTDTLGLRLSTMYSDFGGFFRNRAVPIAATGAVQPARHFGQSKTLFVRGTALYKPTSDFSARLKLNYTRDRQTGGVPYQLVSCPDGLTDYAGRGFFSAAENCRRDRYLSIVDMDPAAFGGLRNNGVPFTNITQKFGSLELNYDVAPDLTLTSVTGYFNLKMDGLLNGSEAGGAAPALAADKKLRRKEFTQELRLNSDFDSPLNFAAGGFYQNAELTNDILVSGNTRYGFPATLQAGSHEIDIESVSVFGQLRYDVTSDFEVAAGTRWTDERRSDDARTLRAGTIITPATPKLSTKNWSPELTLTYKPTSDLTLFASLKQGYKSGSYNISVPTNPGENNSFGDEKVQGGEIGLKTRLADRQLRVNVAGYYYEYMGLQVGANATVAGGIPIIRTVNAGSAKVYGIDFDMAYAPRSVDGLEFNAAVNWNHARFKTFTNAPCWGGQTIAEGCNIVLNPATGRFQGQDLSGARLVRAPDLQVNLGSSYEMPVGKAMALSFAVDGQYSSKYLANLGRRSDFFQRSYVKVNANVTLKGPEEKWELALIGKNLGNRLTSGSCGSLNYAGGQLFAGIITGAATKGPAGSDELHCINDRGREAWIRLTVKAW